MIVDLLPTEDQRMIEESVRGFLSDRLPVDRLREPHNRGGGAERQVWAELTGLGLFGLGLPEALGGLGFSLPEEALVARALGLFLVSPSVLAQIAAPHLVTDADLRTALISGETRVAFANMIDRHQGHLIDGSDGSHVLVLDHHGTSLLDRAKFGLGEEIASIDESIRLERVAGDIALPDRSAQADRISLLLAAYATGLAQATCEMAVDYAKTREQFGQPIGAFQAIKHQCADMATRAAAAEAQTFHAAVTFGRWLDDASEVAAARLLAHDAALANAKANIQIHGGMGFTAECDAHLFLKRAHVIASLGTSRRAEQRRILGEKS